MAAGDFHAGRRHPDRCPKSCPFGTAVIALALVLTPVLSAKTGQAHIATPDDFDMISTGSIPAESGTKRYTVRRSVLQEMPGAVCIVNGSERRRLLNETSGRAGMMRFLKSFSPTPRGATAIEYGLMAARRRRPDRRPFRPGDSLDNTVPDAERTPHAGGLITPARLSAHLSA